MGAKQSKQKKNIEENDEDDKTIQEKLIKKINKISAELILETKTKDILLFLDPEYCNKIMYIITNILSDSYTKNKLTVIHSYIKNIKEINNEIMDLSNKSISIDLDSEKYDTKQNLCIEIAMFYIKFCHLYAAIVKVINPKKKSNGEIIPMGFCQRRKDLHRVTENTEGKLAVVTDFCKANKRYKKNNMGKTEGYYIKTLKEVGGIAALDILYKDKLSYREKKFVIDDAYKDEYRDNIARVYKAFTGKDNMPDEIQRFSDIPLHDYHKMNLCSKKDKDYDITDEHFGTLGNGIENENLVRYAEHVATIMQTTHKHNKKFLDILDSMFLLNDGEYIIHPELTTDLLNQKIKDTRKEFIEMYIECEEQFKTGIRLFRELIFDAEINKAKRQLKNVDIILENDYKFQGKSFNTHDSVNTNTKESAIRKREEDGEKLRDQYDKIKLNEQEEKDKAWDNKDFYKLSGLKVDREGKLMSSSQNTENSKIENLFDILGGLVKKDKSDSLKGNYQNQIKEKIDEQLDMATENVREQIKQIAEKENWSEESLRYALMALDNRAKAQKDAFT